MRISDWSSDVCSSDLGSPTQALRVDTAEPGHIARGPWVLSAMRSALLSQQAFDGGRRGLCDLGIVRGLHAGNTNAAEFCPRKRNGTPPSTATRSLLSSAGRSMTKNGREPIRTTHKNMRHV